MKHLLFILSLIIFFCPVFSQQLTDKTNPFPKTITVSGSAEMEIIPDEIYVVVDLREYEKRGQDKIDIETIKSSFLQKCKDLSLPDSAITIASYEGSNNPWLKKKKKAELYSSISYQIKFTKSSDIDKLVDKLDDDATQNFRIIKTSHSRMSEFRKQLKIQAVKAAKEKGIYLTDAIGEKLGEAITINEGDENLTNYNNLANNNQVLSQYRTENNYQFTPGRANYFNDAGEENPETLIDFKRIKLRYEVNIVFALK
jgi:hypothetical protein